MEPSILVIDDEPNIREAFELMLGGDFELRLAASAEDALATPEPEAGAVRLIFLDGILGLGMSGDRALPALQRRFPGARIVYIGASGAIKVSALKAAGVSKILPKPWKVEDLVATALWGLAEETL